ncbi:uncharacterized protein LOC119371325 [Jatropha curcas]|uniref:uncharacterized protein LOC119371325 n=1 Tax=Jatropha curcas TaxID=180498 RepID=UPI00189392C9|nr:uncharacterized protein LOC119371325 [Jatropha curcas]
MPISLLKRPGHREDRELVPAIFLEVQNSRKKPSGSKTRKSARPQVGGSSHPSRGGSRLSPGRQQPPPTAAAAAATRRAPLAWVHGPGPPAQAGRARLRSGAAGPPAIGGCGAPAIGGPSRRSPARRNRGSHYQVPVTPTVAITNLHQLHQLPPSSTATNAHHLLTSKIYGNTGSQNGGPRMNEALADPENCPNS